MACSNSAHVDSPLQYAQFIKSKKAISFRFKVLLSLFIYLFFPLTVDYSHYQIMYAFFVTC